MTDEITIAAINRLRRANVDGPYFPFLGFTKGLPSLIHVNKRDGARG